MFQKVADIELETDAPDWLSGEDARWLIGKYVEQCERYGGVQSTHFRLACIAAVPLLLTPEILNFLRARFLPESDADWLAEADLLLSPLCQLIDSRLGIYEMDPRVRRDLISHLTVEEKRAVAQYVLDYATGRDYPFETMRATHYWLSKAILEPDTAAGAVQHETAQPIFTGWQALHLGQILNWDLLKTENKNLGIYQHFANRLDAIIRAEQYEEEPSSEKRRDLLALLQRSLSSDTAELITELTLPTPPTFIAPTNLSEKLLGNPFDPAACRYEGDVWFQGLFDYDLETKQFNWWNRLFVARTPLLATLRDALNSKQPMLITGPEGTGRTTLLHWLRHSLKEDGLEPVFLSSAEMANAVSVAEGQELIWLGQQLLNNLPIESQRTYSQPEGLNDSAALWQWIDNLSLALADQTGGWVLIDHGDNNSRSLVQALGNRILDLAERRLFLILVPGSDRVKSAFARQIVTTEWWSEEELTTVIRRRLEAASRNLSPIRTLSDLRPDWSEADLIGEEQTIRGVMAAAAWLLVRDGVTDLLKKGNFRQVVTLCQNVLRCYDNPEARQLLQEALRDLSPRDIWNSGEYESAVAHLAKSSTQADQLLAEHLEKLLQIIQDGLASSDPEQKSSLQQEAEAQIVLWLPTEWEKPQSYIELANQAESKISKVDFSGTINTHVRRPSTDSSQELGERSTIPQPELELTEDAQNLWQTINDIIEEARDDFEKGRWQECLKKFEEARNKDSGGLFSKDLDLELRQIETEIRARMDSMLTTVQIVIPTEKWPGLLSMRIHDFYQIPHSLYSADEMARMQHELSESSSNYLTRHFTSHLAPLLSLVSSPGLETSWSVLAEQLVETSERWKKVREDELVRGFLKTTNEQMYQEIISVLDEIARLLPDVHEAAEVSLQLDEAITLCEQVRDSDTVQPALSQATELINKREVNTPTDYLLRPRYERLEVLRDQLIRRSRSFELEREARRSARVDWSYREASLKLREAANLVLDFAPTLSANFAEEAARYDEKEAYQQPFLERVAEVEQQVRAGQLLAALSAWQAANRLFKQMPPDVRNDKALEKIRGILENALLNRLRTAAKTKDYETLTNLLTQDEVNQFAFGERSQEEIQTYRRYVNREQARQSFIEALSEDDLSVAQANLIDLENYTDPNDREETQELTRWRQQYQAGEAVARAYSYRDILQEQKLVGQSSESLRAELYELQELEKTLLSLRDFYLADPQGLTVILELFQQQSAVRQAQLYEKEEKFEQAVVAYEAVANINPDNPAWMRAANRIKETLKHYQAAKEAGSDQLEEAVNHLAQIDLESRNWPQVQALYQDYLRKLREQGNLAERSQDYQSALYYYRFLQKLELSDESYSRLARRLKNELDERRHQAALALDDYNISSDKLAELIKEIQEARKWQIERPEDTEKWVPRLVEELTRHKETVDQADQHMQQAQQLLEQARENGEFQRVFDAFEGVPLRLKQQRDEVRAIYEATVTDRNRYERISSAISAFEKSAKKLEDMNRLRQILREQDADKRLQVTQEAWEVLGRYLADA